jgi:hypothetical protein
MGILSIVRNISPSLYRLRILAIIVTLLVVPFVLYYLVFVRSQTAYFTERSFRKLSLIGSQITSKIESVGLVLKNNSEKLTGLETFDPARTQENVEDLREILAALKDDGPQIVPLKIEAVPADSQKSPAPLTFASESQETDGPKLYVNSVSPSRDAKTLVTVQAKVDLSDLLQPLLNPRTYVAGAERDQFQNILIAEAATGKVIFQQDTTQVRLASLDKLTSAEDPTKKIELKDFPQTSNLVDVTLAGSSYKLFSQPIEIGNASWIVCGLIRADYFRNEVWSISYTILIFCGFITVLLILSWPFLKLVLIGRKDRLGTADVYFLTFAIVVTAAVFTAMGFYGYSYLKDERLMDAQLRTLADEGIKENLNAELTAALQQLDGLSKNCALLKSLGSTAPCPADIPTGVYQNAEFRKTTVLPEILNAGAATTYPYFDTAVWIDDTGLQRAKWTIKNEVTQHINVSSRGYFSNLRRGNFYQLGEHRFWLEPIISKTTGRNEVEISKLTYDPKWIAAFDTRLISLMQPVLPAGFGYVVIAKDGKVLFHSDEAHHLGENFFQECDDDPELLSAVLGRSDRLMNVRYVGEGHRAFITTLDGFPQWSLVVFRNKQPLRSAFLELLTLVSVLFLIYTLIIFVCFSVFYLLNVRNERRAWLWPCPQKRGAYYQSFLLLLALSIISGLLTIVLHGQWLVVAIAGIGLLSALVFFLNLRFGDKGLWPRRLGAYLRDKWLGRFDVAYVMNLAFLLLLISILPATAFFKYAYESEMKVFIKHGQFTFASELARRDQRIRTHYMGIKSQADDQQAAQTTNGETVVVNPFATRRIGVHWDLYNTFFFDTHCQAPVVKTCPDEPVGDLISEINRFLPLYNQMGVERRGLLATTIANGFGKWEPGDAGRLVLHIDKSTIGETVWPRRHLNSVLPGLGIPGPIWLGIFLVGFGAFFFFVHFLVRKVFLLDIYKPSSRPLSAFLSEKIDRNLFVVVDAPFGTKIPSADSNLQVIDLQKLVIVRDGVATIEKPLGCEGKVLALDHFDFQSNDPKTNQLKLGLVEELLATGRPLVIFSAVEPSQYSFNNGENGQENAELEDTGRWAGVMSQFLTEYADDTGDPQTFTRRVEEERQRILALDLQGRPKEEVSALIDCLHSECVVKGPLQQIGLQILAQNSFIALTHDHLLNRIISQARTYYNHLWKSCSTPEKVTLCHLAKDRLLSHRDPDIQSLLRRKLIVRETDLHLLNESFRQFIKSTEKIAFVTKEEDKAKQASPWHMLKGPIMIGLVAVTIFFFVTQRDMYTSSLAIVTAVTTIIPAFFKVLTIFHSDPFERPSGQG